MTLRERADGRHAHDRDAGACLYLLKGIYALRKTGFGISPPYLFKGGCALPPPRLNPSRAVRFLPSRYLMGNKKSAMGDAMALRDAGTSPT